MTKLTYKLSAIITRQFALVFCLCVCITAQASRQHSQHSQQHGSHHVQHHPQKHLKGSNGTHLQHAYVAFCAIMRNEHLNVAEWIQYHAWLGVEKFYIFDHGSKPPISVVLQEYVEQGIVEVFHFQNSWQVDAHQFGEMYKTPVRQFLSPQGWAYDNCYRWFGHRHTWIALLDVDEFVVVRDSMHQHTQPHLPTFLKTYEPYGGLMVHWQLFGPSGHISRPANGTLRSYTQCIPKSRLQAMHEFQAIPLGFMKSFTQTRHYRAGCNPHTCVLKPGVQYVNEDFQALSARVIKEVHWNKIAVFHYVTRSKEDYAVKVARGSGHSQYLEANRRAGRTSRGWNYFASINATAVGTCLEGQWLWQSCCAHKKPGLS